MAAADPDNDPNQTINENLCDGTVLIGYGKHGHGMNGKDADIDRIGQCCVTELVTEDPVGADSMRIAIHLRLYASIGAPGYGSIDFEALREAPSDLKEHFKSMGVDVDKLDVSDTSWDTERQLEKIVEFYREQATLIVCGMNSSASDHQGFMWDGDEAWDGGVDITLHVPLSVDEYEAIEDGDEDTLDTVAGRIYREIADANKGGTPERDRLKLFEETVGTCNDMINELLYPKQANEQAS